MKNNQLKSINLKFGQQSLPTNTLCHGAPCCIGFKRDLRFSLISKPRINCRKVQFGIDTFKKKFHINYIGNFWGIAKMGLSKFRGVRTIVLNFHLKEIDFWFNHRNEDIYILLL
jgi:hypothetical protein